MNDIFRAAPHQKPWSRADLFRTWLGRGASLVLHAAMIATLLLMVTSASAPKPPDPVRGLTRAFVPDDVASLPSERRAPPPPKIRDVPSSAPQVVAVEAPPVQIERRAFPGPVAEPPGPPPSAPAEVVTSVFGAGSVPIERTDSGKVEVGLFGRPRNQGPPPGIGGAGAVVVGKWAGGQHLDGPPAPDGGVGPTGVFTPSAAPQQTPVAPETRDERARLLSAPTPSYTDEARRLHVTGDVLLEVLLAASGEVRVLRVLSGLGHGLDESAIDAVSRTRCRPAVKAGRPVDVIATITVVFKLT